MKTSLIVTGMAALAALAFIWPSSAETAHEIPAPAMDAPATGPQTLVVAVGYSTWIRIGGKRVVLSNLDGLTDGTVPGTVHYQVRDPWQSYTRADS